MAESFWVSGMGKNAVHIGDTDGIISLALTQKRLSE